MALKAATKRNHGLTEVIDMGIGLNSTEDLVTLTGDYVDLVRLAGGWLFYTREMYSSENWDC